MNKINLYITILCDKEILLKAMKISLIVGTLLNIINQGVYLFNFDFQNLNLIKLILTYIIPFFVSSYTAASMKLKFTIGEVAVSNATLECNMCKLFKDVKIGQFVPVCDNCQEKTKWTVRNYN